MQQGKLVWAILMGISLSGASFGMNKTCLRLALTFAAGEFPKLTSERKLSPALNVTPGNSDTARALEKYLLIKDANDGHLDIFVAVRSFPMDRPPDLSHLYSTVAFFGVDNSLSIRERSGMGMKRNPAAKRAIRIFPVATPLGSDIQTPKEFTAMAKELAEEFEVPVAIASTCINASPALDVTWVSFIPRQSSQLP